MGLHRRSGWLPSRKAICRPLSSFRKRFMALGHGLRRCGGVRVKARMLRHGRGHGLGLGWCLREHDGHGQLIRVDEVQRLGHGDEHLRVDALGHVVLAHELEAAELILGVDEALALDEHGQQRRRAAELLGERKHLLVHEDGKAEVKRRRDAGHEVEGRELARELLHREDHLVDLPLQAVVDVELAEEVHHVRVGPEEDVQPRLDPVAVLVLPGRDLAAEHVTRLVDHRLVPGVDEVLGGGEAREAAADDGNGLAGPALGTEVLKLLG
mmetsp:Transcript_15341/g.46134  ORF Transcript_15341/g.46134 Transcript_15341/m.46134 type:complete len:268 (-) Transcript_15341:321-1124(-)